MFKIDANDPNHATFTLRDAGGAEHRYDIQAHPGDEGYALSNRLAGVMLEALGDAVSGQSVDSLADDFELGRLGAAGRKVLQALPPDVRSDLLQYTNRDGKPLTGANLSAAYARNYAEQYAAIIASIRFNRFFPVPDSWWSVLDSLRGAASGADLEGLVSKALAKALSGRSDDSASPSEAPDAA